MKRIIKIFVSILCLTTSCKKENLQSSITGRWLWVESTGGIAGIHDTPSSTGKTITLVITNDKIKTYINNSLVSDLDYTITKDKTIFGNDLKDVIIIHEGLRFIVDVSGNKLSLNEDAYDGINSSYKRLF